MTIDAPVALWDVFKILMTVVAVPAFGLLWRQVELLKAELAEIRESLATQQLEAERRYVTAKALGELKGDLLKRFDRLELLIDRLMAREAA